MPYDATEIPIEAVRAATAIPIISNLIGVRFGLEISLDNKSATNIDDIKHPKKILNVPNENKPINVDDKKIGEIGEICTEILDNFRIRTSVVGFEINLSGLIFD